MKKIRLAVLIAVLGMTSILSAQKTLTDGIKDLAAQISASATKEQKHRVAVLPFQELDGQSTVLGTYLAEELLSHLVNSGLKIVERGMLDRILAEQKLQNTGAIDPGTAKEVGRIAGVDAIVTGSITDLQSNVGVNCRIIDTTTGEVFAAAQAKITKDDDVKKIMAVVLTRPAHQPQAARSPGPRTTEPTLSWQEGPMRFSIDGLRGAGSVLNMTVTGQNTSDDAQSVQFGPYWLIDDNGDRWSAQLASGGAWTSTNIPPGTLRRFRFTFSPETSAEGTTFTLTNGENNVSYLRNLRRVP